MPTTGSGRFALARLIIHKFSTLSIAFGENFQLFCEVISLNLKEIVEKICDEKGISVREAERKAGLKARTIQHWDTSDPSGEKLYRVAAALEVPIERLLMAYHDENDIAFQRLIHIEELYIEIDRLKKSLSVLSDEEKNVIDLYRKADEHDKETVKQILSRYREDTALSVG